MMGWKILKRTDRKRAPVPRGAAFNRMVRVTPDDVAMVRLPDEVNRFLNEQIYRLAHQDTYPLASLFEEIQRGQIVQSTRPEAEKKAAIMLQLAIGNAAVVWACESCLRVIGLIEKPPSAVLKDSEDFSGSPGKAIAAAFSLLALRDRLKCPSCGAAKYVSLKPTFLISGRSLGEELRRATIE